MTKNHLLIEDILDKKFIKDNYQNFNYQIYDAIAKDKFVESDTYIYPQTLIEDQEKGKVHLLEKRKLSSPFIEKEKDNEVEWNILMTNTLLHLDDWTGDVYDIVRLLWTKQEKNNAGFIQITPEDILHLRGTKPIRIDEDGKPVFRKRDITKAMVELTKLFTLSLSLGKEISDVEIDDKTGVVVNIYESEQFKKLFYVGDYTMYYQNEKPIGFSQVSITPGELLINNFKENSESIKLLSTLALKYNPRHHKYHKRLARYFALFWDIGQKIKSLAPTFPIGGEKGLLKVMGLDIESENSYYKGRPSEIQEQLEKTLVQLHADEVIGGWKYATKNGELDPEKMVGKNWLSYFLNIRVIVLPPSALEQYYQIAEEEISELQNYLPLKEEVRLVLDNERPITPETIIRVRDYFRLKNYNVSQQANITPSTLTRFLNENRVLRKATKEKLITWLTEMLPKIQI